MSEEKTYRGVRLDCLFYIGLFHIIGAGTRCNIKAGLKYIMLAALNNSKIAQEFLSKKEFEGIDFKQFNTFDSGFGFIDLDESEEAKLENLIDKTILRKLAEEYNKFLKEKINEIYYITCFAHLDFSVKAAKMGKFLLDNHFTIKIGDPIGFRKNKSDLNRIEFLKNLYRTIECAYSVKEQTGRFPGEYKKYILQQPIKDNKNLNDNINTTQRSGLTLNVDLGSFSVPPKEIEQKKDIISTPEQKQININQEQTKSVPKQNEEDSNNNEYISNLYIYLENNLQNIEDFDKLKSREQKKIKSKFRRMASIMNENEDLINSNKQAAVIYAIMLYIGIAVPKDIEKGCKFLEKTINENNDFIAIFFAISKCLLIKIISFEMIDKNQNLREKLEEESKKNNLIAKFLFTKYLFTKNNNEQQVEELEKNFESILYTETNFKGMEAYNFCFIKLEVMKILINMKKIIKGDEFVKLKIFVDNSEAEKELWEEACIVFYIGKYINYKKSEYDLSDLTQEKQNLIISRSKIEEFLTQNTDNSVKIFNESSIFDKMLVLNAIILYIKGRSEQENFKKQIYIYLEILSKIILTECNKNIFLNEINKIFILYTQFTSDLEKIDIFFKNLVDSGKLNFSIICHYYIDIKKNPVLMILKAIRYLTKEESKQGICSSNTQCDGNLTDENIENSIDSFKNTNNEIKKEDINEVIKFLKDNNKSKDDGLYINKMILLNKILVFYYKDNNAMFQLYLIYRRLKNEKETTKYLNMAAENGNGLAKSVVNRLKEEQEKIYQPKEEIKIKDDTTKAIEYSKLTSDNKTSLLLEKIKLENEQNSINNITKEIVDAPENEKNTKEEYLEKQENMVDIQINCP